MKKSKQELKTYFETGDKPTEGQYADLIDSYVDSKQEKGDSNRRFVIDEDGEVLVSSEQNIPEYTLSEISDNKLGLLKDGVVVKEIDLAAYIDDTNLSRLVSGDLNKTTGILTVVREDNSSFNIDLSSLTNEVPEKQTIDELFLSDKATVPLRFSGSGSSSSITSNQMRVNGSRSYGFVNSSLIGVEAQDASSQTHIEKDSLVIRENGKNTSLESGSPTKDVKVALPSESGKLVIESAIPEYTLSEITANKLSLLKNGVVVKEIDLTSYVDDTNLARLISGTVGADGVATFKRDDDSTFTVDFSSIVINSVSQIQADWNQTDGTQPDFVKNKPLTTLKIGNVNGTEEFETNKIQFDEFHQINSAENEIQINPQYFQLKTLTYLFSSYSGVLDSNISEIGENINTLSTYNLGNIFRNPATINDSVIICHLKNHYKTNFGLPHVSNGNILPNEIIVKGYLTPVNCKLIWFKPVDKVMFFEQKFEGVGLQKSFLVENIITGKRSSVIEGVKSNYFTMNKKEYDSKGNIIDVSQDVNYQVRSSTGDSIILEDCQFYLTYSVTVNFKDSNNVNDDNKNFDATVSNNFLNIELIR